MTLLLTKRQPLLLPLHVGGGGKLLPHPDDKWTKIEYNNPLPCVNGRYEAVSTRIRGVVEHTMVGNSPGTISVFNRPGFDASADFAIDQAGVIHQFGPIGKGWVAWAEVAGNDEWYSIEFADDGNTFNPLTQFQMDAGGQVYECLSGFAGFPLRVTNSVDGTGFGIHNMGGMSWGGHTCPGPGPRSAQRVNMLYRAHRIRVGKAHRKPVGSKALLERLPVRKGGTTTCKLASHK